MDITWSLEKRKLTDLKDYAKNPRKISKDQVEQLKKNITKFGLIDKPFINTDNVVIGGHQRIRLLKKMGYDEIEVHVPDRTLTDKEVEELNYRHNENGGAWDFDILANQYDHIDLLSWGDDPLGPEEKEKKAAKPKVIFEFDSKQDLEEHAELIETASITWNAKMKVKS